MDKLKKIFEKQRELMEKYEKIEAMNGFEVFNPPVDINDMHCQAKIKDYFWRITEELCEAIDAYDNKDYNSYKEEVVDVLHFLTELSIIIGLEPEEIPAVRKSRTRRYDMLDILFNGLKNNFDDGLLFRDIRMIAFHLIIQLGLTSNKLKNRPWKQSLKNTDVVEFKKAIVIAWHIYILLAKASGFNPESLYDEYFKKNKKNKQRQNTGY